MRAAFALSIVVLGVAMATLSACKDENRACCAIPERERSQASPSSVESAQTESSAS